MAPIGRGDQCAEGVFTKEPIVPEPGEMNRRVVRAAPNPGFEVIADPRELAKHRAKPATASSLHAERSPSICFLWCAPSCRSLETFPPHGLGSDGRAILGSS